MDQIINNQTTLQDDTNRINQCVSEIVNEFGKDTYIGESYAKLAESASQASQALDRLAQYLEERQRQWQV